MNVNPLSYTFHILRRWLISTQRLNILLFVLLLKAKCSAVIKDAPGLI